MTLFCRHFFIRFTTILLTLLLCKANVFAQQLYGLTSSGGKGFGSIVSLPVGGNTLSSIVPIEGVTGGYPGYTQCVEAPNGKLYGMTSYGGENTFGVIFEYDPTSGFYNEVHHFTAVDGAGAYGTLLLASNGKLYGTTFGSGLLNGGTLFEYDYINDVFLKLHDFDPLSIYWPANGGLVEHSPGILLGITQFGGTNNAGGIYEYNFNTNTYSVLTELNSTNGLHGIGTLVKGTNGLYYSTTLQGGLNGLGVIFSYDYNTNTILNVHDLDGVLGGSTAGVLTHVSGKFYGLTNNGGANGVGVLFEYDYVADVFTKKQDLDYLTGSGPWGCSLVLASNSLLYGLTTSGGTTGQGVLFSYDITSNVYTNELNLADFGGNGPNGTLVQASNGKLYGMTTYGGKAAYGILFEYTIASNTASVKVDFKYSENGSSAFAGMVKAPNNKLYGCLTFQGGNNAGTLFEFDPATNVFTKKFDFGGLLGELPHNTMILSADGNLYGTTHLGGANSSGVIYRYNYISNTFTKLYDLPASSHAPGNLIEGAVGKLYGTVWLGGANSLGMLYEFDVNTLTLSTLHDFAGPDGQYAFGHPVLVGSDRLFGITEAGGLFGNGVIYEYNLTTSTYSIVHDFNGTDGSTSRSSLVLASNGNLYGTADVGGSNGLGTLFEYDVANTTFSVKHDFTSLSGGQPYGGSMYEASNGKLYGTTIIGGSNGLGVIYEYDFMSDTYTSVIDLSSSSGFNPLYTQLVEANPCTQPTIATAGVTSATICTGDNTTLQVLSGSLNDATQWQWYSGSCNGTPVGTGTNLVVSPGTTTTYYVRGEGGCVTPAACSNAVTVTVNAPYTWWLNADGDNYAASSMLACSSPGAGWTATAPPFNGDCNDANPAIPMLTEICGNNIDDNCNGQTDEACGGPNVDVFINAPLAPVSGGAYPGGNCYPNSLVGASVSPEGNPANVLLTGGQDHWYKFVAQSTAARFVCTTSSMNVVLELHNAATAQVDAENDVANLTGGEIMVTTGLTIGATYFLAVRSYDGVVGPYTVCLQMLMPSYCADGSGVYDLCSNFKPAYTGATSYTFNFTPTGITPGSPTSATAVGQIALSLPSLALRHLGTYNVVINANFTLFDAASNNESITVPGIAVCNISIAAHPDEQVKLAQRCPASIFKGTTLQAKPFVCGAINHTIEFTEVSDCLGSSIVGVPFNVNTSGSSSNINLNSVGGVQAGKWYAVRWRPNFSYGPGSFGTVQYIQVVASSSENVNGEFDGEIQPGTGPEVQVYPNPNDGKVMNLSFADYENEWITLTLADATGNTVCTKGIFIQSEGTMQLALENKLAAGLYFLSAKTNDSFVVKKIIVQ